MKLLFICLIAFGVFSLLATYGADDPRQKWAYTDGLL
jgi:uncharacterized membrane protein